MGSGIFTDTGSIAWATSSAGAAGSHKLDVNFGSSDPATYIGVYESQRIIAEDVEAFKLAICYYNEPSNIYESPNDADDIFKFDRSLGS